LKPLLDVVAREENDKVDTVGSVIFIQGVAVVKLDFEEEEGGAVSAKETSSSGSQPRHPGHGGAFSYVKKFSGSFNSIAFRFCSGVASFAYSNSTSSTV
jgi:hypothetical protein